MSKRTRSGELRRPPTRARAAVDNWGDEPCDDVRVEGRVFEGIGGPGVPTAVVLFESVDGSVRRSARTNKSGRYRVELPPGKYVKAVSSAGFERIERRSGSAMPSLIVEPCAGTQTSNFFTGRPLTR